MAIARAASSTKTTATLVVRGRVVSHSARAHLPHLPLPAAHSMARISRRGALHWQVMTARHPPREPSTALRPSRTLLWHARPSAKRRLRTTPHACKRRWRQYVTCTSCPHRLHDGPSRLRSAWRARSDSGCTSACTLFLFARAPALNAVVATPAAPACDERWWRQRQKSPRHVLSAAQRDDRGE